MISEHLFTRDNVTQYFFGFFGTGTSNIMSGVDTLASVIAATIVPALIMLLVNLPKLIRECVYLYRELKNGKDNGKNKERDN